MSKLDASTGSIAAPDAADDKYDDDDDDDDRKLSLLAPGGMMAKRGDDNIVTAQCANAAFASSSTNTLTIGNVSNKMTPAQQSSLASLKSHLTCALCARPYSGNNANVDTDDDDDGNEYSREPAILMTCMHTFCRSCISAHMENDRHCPLLHCHRSVTNFGSSNEVVKTNPIYNAVSKSLYEIERIMSMATDNRWLSSCNEASTSDKIDNTNDTEEMKMDFTHAVNNCSNQGTASKKKRKKKKDEDDEYSDDEDDDDDDDDDNDNDDDDNGSLTDEYATDDSNIDSSRRGRKRKNDSSDQVAKMRQIPPSSSLVDTTSSDDVSFPTANGVDSANASSAKKNNELFAGEHDWLTEMTDRHLLGEFFFFASTLDMQRSLQTYVTRFNIPDVDLSEIETVRVLEPEGHRIPCIRVNLSTISRLIQRGIITADYMEYLLRNNFLEIRYEKSPTNRKF